jgi:hypothetical protein
VNITRRDIKRIFSNQDNLTKIPMFRWAIDEYLQRVNIYKKQPGCSSCRQPLFVDDIVEKMINQIRNFTEDESKKIKSFFNTSEQIFLVCSGGNGIEKELIVK